MTRPYSLETSTKSIATANPETLLDGFEEALKSGEQFTLAIARSASHTLKQINQILKEHGVELQVQANSDPKAADYVVNAVFGGVLGAAGGAGTGAALWTIARIAGSTPPLAPFILVGGVIGFLAGAATGAAVTHWGLTVRFAPASSKLELEFVPAR